MNSSTEHITINEVDIERFRELYRIEFKEEINNQEASNKARTLINLFLVVLGKYNDFEIKIKNNI